MRLLLLALTLSILRAETPFEIQVIDRETGHGVPCVELETVDHVRYVTDSAGRIAYQEPGHASRIVFFYTRAHGYEFQKDGFGQNGVRLRITPGGKEIIQARRINLAERLYRTTGEGIYRDSILLGHKVPLAQPLLNADVAGQDSIQRVIYRDRIHWFWGDTTRLSYPLGNFRMSGATSELPSNGGLNPAHGVDYRYFTNSDGGPKGMFPIPPAGDLIWADGFLVLTNGSAETMLAHYQRLKGLDKPIGHGLARYNDATQEFELLAPLPDGEKWRFPHGHPLKSGDYYFFGAPLPNVRVVANFQSITNRAAYEAWSCLSESDPSSVAEYRWTKAVAPTGPSEEKELVDKGLLAPERAGFLPRDLDTGRPVLLHGGTVAWNEWRQRWIFIGVEIRGSSMLGELWYSEAEQPTGPWRAARKIATHDKYSFYNPAQHPFFDQKGGKIIYFEGTYTQEFSGGTSFTPRYDYNQIMYRLDLSRVEFPK